MIKSIKPHKSYKYILNILKIIYYLIFSIILTYRKLILKVL